MRRAFTQMVAGAHPDDAPPWKLEFRAARDKDLGPNALALPGGTIVLTDELVRLMPVQGKDSDDAVLGVLGHEFGHVRLRHSMRQLVQASAVGFATSVAFGDYGTLIGSAPVLLATLGYSRDAEREADAESVRLMRAVGISPNAMVGFFEAIERWRDQKRSGAKGDADESPIGMAFSTHPATAERIQFFKDAARE
jgi:Zn-dependent protease with chaperone function